MIGDELCEDLEVKQTHITCLPPKSEPIDVYHENPRVKVSVFYSRLLSFCTAPYYILELEL